MASEMDDFLITNFRNRVQDGSRIRLQSHFQDIKVLLGSDLPPDQSWPADIRETLHSLNSVLEECEIKPKGKLLTCSDPTKDKLNKIKEEIKNFTPCPKSSNETEVPRQSSRSVDASKVHGFDNDVISLEKVLLSQESKHRFKAIGITGIAGIGKTTLCQFLFNKKEVKDYFLPRIWVCMSKQPGDDTDGKVAILKRMLVNLGVEEEIINQISRDQDEVMKGLLYALHLQLQGKRYLIVFDDARDRNEWYGELSSSPTREGKWDRLAHGLPKGCGGAVIVTSRDEKLAKAMTDPKGIAYRVLPLLDPECCWSIFKDAAEQGGKPFNLPDNAEIKKEIFKRCSGLPLTAKMMGQIIAKKPAEEGAPNESHQPHPEGAAPNDESHQQPQLPEGAAPNGQSNEQLPEGAAPNDQSDQQLPLPEGAAPNDQSDQQLPLPEGAAPNDQSHQQLPLPDGAAPNDQSHQQLPLPEGAAPNDQSHQQLPLPEGAAPNDQSHQQLPLPEGAAPNDQRHQQLPEEGATNESHQQLPEEGAPNESHQQLPEEGAPNDQSHQQLPEVAAPNESQQHVPVDAASNGSKP
jgi:hypothetical protein